MAYRPPGRSNRSGRVNAESDVFEGLPVRQWDHLLTHVSLAPPQPVSTETQVADRWADPPMPRDHQLLHPWTQQLLRIARSGKVGTKRRQDHDATHDDDRPDDENGAAADQEAARNSVENRGYSVWRWKPVPEAHLEPEHKHLEFLAKRRKGLQNSNGPDAQNGATVAMRKTHVQHAGADGELAVYAVLVPVGQTIEGEVAPDASGVADLKTVVAAPGTTIEGVGVANDEGVLVAEHLKRNSNSRKNRPPPKRKAGPGRGKKRVTFTNSDGSTYTKIVPNATKIVPKPGQTIKHVAKGEEATADVSAEQAAANVTTEDGTHHGDGTEGEEGEDGDDDGEDDGEDDDDDDDREEGEITDDEPRTETATPAPSESKATPGANIRTGSDPPPPGTSEADSSAPPAIPSLVETSDDPIKSRNVPSSPDQPLSKSDMSPQPSLATTTNALADSNISSAEPLLANIAPVTETATDSEIPVPAVSLPEAMEIDDLPPRIEVQPEHQNVDILAALQQSLGFASGEPADEDPVHPESNDMDLDIEKQEPDSTSLPTAEQAAVAIPDTLPDNVELKAENTPDADMGLQAGIENADSAGQDSEITAVVTSIVGPPSVDVDQSLVIEEISQQGELNEVSVANESLDKEDPALYEVAAESEQPPLADTVPVDQTTANDADALPHTTEDHEKAVSEPPADKEASEAYSHQLDHEPA